MEGSEKRRKKDLSSLQDLAYMAYVKSLSLYDQLELAQKIKALANSKIREWAKTVFLATDNYECRLTSFNVPSVTKCGTLSCIHNHDNRLSRWVFLSDQKKKNFFMRHAGRWAVLKCTLDEFCKQNPELASNVRAYFDFHPLK